VSLDFAYVLKSNSTLVVYLSWVCTSIDVEESRIIKNLIKCCGVLYPVMSVMVKHSWSVQILH